MVDINTVARDVRKMLNLDPDSGILGIQTGASAGQIHVPYKSGYVWVCERQASGYSAPKAIRRHPNANIRMKPGIGVLMGYDEKGERCVLSEDFDAVAQSGETPAGSNPLDPALQFKTQDQLVTGLCTPDNPDTTLYCVVNGLIFYRNRTAYRWGNATKVNLTSFVPGTSNYHCLACVFVLADGSATEVKASTAQSQLAPLDITDENECLAAATPGSTPIWFWRLYNGQTAVKASDTWRDGRGVINVGLGEGDTLAAILTTSNNTITTITSISVSELQAYTISGSFIATKSDYTASLTGTFRYGFRRATGGNVTQIAAATVSADDDSAGTPALSLDVDTATQTARIRATGITAETWSWRVQYTMAKLP